MEYTTSMKLENNEKDELRKELMRVSGAITYIARYSLSMREDSILYDKISDVDQCLCDLANILCGQYQIEGLILVLFDNTLRECRKQLRELIKAFNEKDISTTTIVASLENIEGLFVLRRW